MGAWKVIGEAREGGNVGLFRSTGEGRSGLVQEILTKIPFEKIIWEAPQKAQQVWFIKLLGMPTSTWAILRQLVIPLETIRLGLRGRHFCTSSAWSGRKTEAPTLSGGLINQVKTISLCVEQKTICCCT